MMDSLAELMGRAYRNENKFFISLIRRKNNALSDQTSRFEKNRVPERPFSI